MRPLRWGLGVIAVAILTLTALALASTGSAFAEVTGAADNLRTGWYADEPSLTPELLKSKHFEQVFETKLTGQIYAQPLVADGTLLVATEDNWVYGLDPLTGKVRWEKQLGTAVNASDPAIECAAVSPHIGITGTPVIDTEKNIAYFTSNRYVSGSSGEMAWYMHAIELGNEGKEVSGFPVEIKGEAQNVNGLKFEPTQHLQRPALLLMNGIVYAGFASHCDKEPYEGWLAGVSTSGQLKTMWATGLHAGGIWQSGGGLLSDGPGQILFVTGNGTGSEGDPSPGPGKSPLEGSLSDSVVRVEVQHETELKATDFFSPFNTHSLNELDLDLGSGGPIGLPSPYFGTPSTPHLLVESGKDGRVFLLNRDNLGGMAQGPGGTDAVIQKLGPYGGQWDAPALWPGEGGYVYIDTVPPDESAGATEGGYLRFFKYGVNGTTGEPELSLAGTSSDEFGYGSGSPIVTSSGTSGGSALLWVTHCPATYSVTCEKAYLRAYSPVPSKEVPRILWEAPIGRASKFSRPDAANGHVYVGNTEGDIFAYSGPALTPPVVTSIEPTQGPGDQLGLAAPPVPTVANAAQSNSTWREGNKLATFSRKKKPPVGTTFSFILNKQARVSFAFTQQVGGRNVKGKCVAQTKKNRRKPSCKRTVTRGTLSFIGHGGTNKVSFQGRISASKKLPLGRYKLVIIATNAAGQRSSPKSLSFTIVK